jgi:hypothetical protein
MIIYIYIFMNIVFHLVKKVLTKPKNSPVQLQKTSWIKFRKITA